MNLNNSDYENLRNLISGNIALQAALQNNWIFSHHPANQQRRVWDRPPFNRINYGRDVSTLMI